MFCRKILQSKYQMQGQTSEGESARKYIKKTLNNIGILCYGF
jgi:hypothetical protein